MTIAAFVISVLALVSSAGAVWYAREQSRIERARHRQEILDRQAAEEAARLADIRVNLVTTPRTDRKLPDRHVAVTNHGPAVARDVRLRLIDPDGWTTQDSDAAWPTTLRPGDTVQQRVLILWASTANAAECEVTWTDDTGPRQARHTLLR